VRPGCAAGHSPPSSVAVMEEQSYTSTHPLSQTGPVTGSLYLSSLIFPTVSKEYFGHRGQYNVFRQLNQSDLTLQNRLSSLTSHILKQMFQLMCG